MKIASIHHAAIIRADCERSKQFYTEVLGLKIIADALPLELYETAATPAD
jgi:glyoxylase I family protein